MIPHYFPATFTDTAQYAQRHMAVVQIQAVLDFEGRLDAKRLERAFRLSLDAVPIMGCVLEPGVWRTRWRRLPDQELDKYPLLDVCTGSEKEQSKKEGEFLGRELDVLARPQVRGTLFQRAEGDRLVVKVGHYFPDAAGTRDWLYLLCSIYRKLEPNPKHAPHPNLADRSLKQVYGRPQVRSLCKKKLAAAWEYNKRTTGAIPLGFPLTNEKVGAPRFAIRRWSPHKVGLFQRIFQAHGATINDGMAAGLLRALASLADKDSEGYFRLSQTFDLRKYLPQNRSQSVCHLSSGFTLDLGPDLGETYGETLDRVKKDIDSIKESHFSLRFMAAIRNLFQAMPTGLRDKAMVNSWKSMIQKQQMPVIFTNMGDISKKDLNFGQPKVKAADFLIPAIMPPAFGVGLSGFGGGLTMTAGFWESATKAGLVEKLFDRVETEILSGEKI